MVSFILEVLATEITYEPQSNLEEKDNPSILKDDFSSKTDPSIFTSTTPSFPALKSTSHFLPQSTVSHRSHSSLDANFSCCHKSNA